MARLKAHPPAARRLLTAVLLSFTGIAAQSADLAWSAFGTIGGAVSDRDYRYQRNIDSRGTLERDSVFGAQVDAQFTPEWSATLQAKLAPSLRNDGPWDLSASWAFVSWRPSNEWLVRAGKLRVPIYLFSENLDVGQSYDMVRMPNETYSIAPTTDITGLYLTRTWMLPASELSVDVLSGSAPVYHRIYSRDDGTQFAHVKTRVNGAVVSWRNDDLTLRAGWMHAVSNMADIENYASTLQYMSMGPGVGFYVPGDRTSHISNDVLTLGMDWRLAQGWRVLAEYERNVQHRTTMGADTYGAHIAVLKSLDRWTPYVSLAGIKSTSAQKRLRDSLLGVQVPDSMPGADQIMAGQRKMIDGLPFADQYSISIGTSFAINAHSKLKAELMHTEVLSGSVMIDSPRGGPPIANEGINVLSLSYNFAF